MSPSYRSFGNGAIKGAVATALAISLGGDADTLAAIAGPIAYAHYRMISEALIEKRKATLPKWMLDLNDRFDIYHSLCLQC